MVDNQAMMKEAKVLIQVGDSHYLEQLLAKHKLTSQAHCAQFVSRLKSHHDYDLAAQICKNGSVDMLKFFRTHLADKDQVPQVNAKNQSASVFNLDFVDEQGQNCLHYAVARNHHAFVRHLLLEDGKNKIDVNQQTKQTKETPLFFALGKIKNEKDKLRMVETLLQKQELNVSAINAENQYAFEAYQQTFGADQATNLVESKHLSRTKLTSKDTKSPSSLYSQVYLNDFDQKEREAILMQKNSADKTQAERQIERHIFAQGDDFDYRKELIHQLQYTNSIQKQLKDLQGQAVTQNPYKYIDKGELKKQLDKKFMEFVGVSLISNLRQRN